ncbi:hypothetical protein PRIC1_013646 [Phytophthora ramorum]|uniref:uncharacterized protein n=1 Tax=Phytophthora ramorum TaxID=164328 RepID=UPI0030A6191B|nr:hypothetical protein KRP23_8355 [Phytophthora ramorum]KAH7500773.1 hypothetical protein KRP22_10018 [Phytophthora ramorum]
MTSTRELLTFADEPDVKAPCSRISVRGDATYCIKGPVCGVTAYGSKQVKGACPSKGDGAIGHCLVSSLSFATGCIAPVDAHCVLSAAGDWECVYPVSDGSATKSKDAGNATEVPSGATRAPVVSLVPLPAAALSASTEYSKAASEDKLETKDHAPSAALNVIVGVACCMLAIVGLMFVKKRRNRARPDRMLSSSGSGIMTL